MKRRGWMLLAAAILAGGGAMALFRPRPAGEFPLAELVPADAVLYAGFADIREIEALAARFPGARPDLGRLFTGEARARLAGPAAFYLDRKGEFVFLARLGGAAAALAGSEIEDGCFCAAQSPESLARHKSRKGTILEVPAFRELRSRVFLNLETLGLPGRLRDFSAVGFEIETGPETVVRGRAAYRGEVFRTYLERYVQAPREAGPPAGPVGATFVDSPPRVWDEALRALPAADRDLAEREAALLSRDFLEGRGVREFLAGLGPDLGVSVSPRPPTLALWLDVPDAGVREKLERMLPRLGQDVSKYCRDRGRPAPFEVSPEEDRWRVRFPWEADLRMGEGFRPVYAFRGSRWVLASRPEALDTPPPTATGQHAAAAVDVDAAFEVVRALVPLLADRAYRAEAEPLRHAKERERIEGEIAAWRRRLDGLGRISGTGRYTGSGLAFELRLSGKPR